MPLHASLASVLRPASSGPVRYWQDQARLAVKGALAAAVAWTLARYGAGQADPYFAPLAALLGVYSTVARSLREVARYVGGFLLGAALAVPVGLLLGPGIAGIAVLVLVGVLVSGWRLLGDQSNQVTFTALFVLLLGGHDPQHYVAHRAGEVAIGVVTGLVVNIVVFPPLQLRPAEHAIGRWGADIASALDCLADATAGQGSAARSWPDHDRRLSVAGDQARGAASRARDSLRWNPRARVRQNVPRPDDAILDALEALTWQTRALARSALRAGQDEDPSGITAPVRDEIAELLRCIASSVRQLADQRSARPGTDDLQAATRRQHDLERTIDHLPVGQAGDTTRRMSGLSKEMLREVTPDNS
jgi:uncharacterized membrane protein YccC